MGRRNPTLIMAPSARHTLLDRGITLLIWDTMTFIYKQQTSLFVIFLNILYTLCLRFVLPVISFLIICAHFTRIKCKLGLKLTSSSAIAERPHFKVGWPKVEDWNWKTIFYGHYRSIFNYCEIIGLQSYGIRWKRRKIRAITPLKVIQGHRGRCQILSPLDSAQNLLQNDRYKSHHTLKTLLHYPVKPSPDGQTDGRTDRQNSHR